MRLSVENEKYILTDSYAICYNPGEHLAVEKIIQIYTYIYIYNIYIYIYIYIYIKRENIYTGCPRRKGQNFGRVFLMLKYTDITQNTYIQS